jgi:hypothetical protein
LSDEPSRQPAPASAVGSAAAVNGAVPYHGDPFPGSSKAMSNAKPKPEGRKERVRPKSESGTIRSENWGEGGNGIKMMPLPRVPQTDNTTPNVLDGTTPEAAPTGRAPPPTQTCWEKMKADWDCTHREPLCEGTTCCMLCEGISFTCNCGCCDGVIEDCEEVWYVWCGCM